MKPAADDLSNRRLVWEALSTLYLDADTSQFRTWRARVLAGSPYSIQDLERILVTEVHPACRRNLRVVAGEWASFDPKWLEEQILHPSRTRSFIRWLNLAQLTVPRSTEWQETRQEIVSWRQKQPE